MDQRNRKVCDACSQAKIQCSGGVAPCTFCAAHDIQCVFPDSGNGSCMAITVRDPYQVELYSCTQDSREPFPLEQLVIPGKEGSCNEIYVSANHNEKYFIRCFNHNDSEVLVKVRVDGKQLSTRSIALDARKHVDIDSLEEDTPSTIAGLQGADFQRCVPFAMAINGKEPCVPIPKGYELRIPLVFAVERPVVVVDDEEQGQMGNSSYRDETPSHHAASKDDLKGTIIAEFYRPVSMTPEELARDKERRRLAKEKSMQTSQGHTQMGASVSPAAKRGSFLTASTKAGTPIIALRDPSTGTKPGELLERITLRYISREVFNELRRQSNERSAVFLHELSTPSGVSVIHYTGEGAVDLTSDEGQRPPESMPKIVAVKHEEEDFHRNWGSHALSTKLKGEFRFDPDLANPAVVKSHEVYNEKMAAFEVEFRKLAPEFIPIAYNEQASTMFDILNTIARRLPKNRSKILSIEGQWGGGRGFGCGQGKKKQTGKFMNFNPKLVISVPLYDDPSSARPKESYKALTEIDKKLNDDCGMIVVEIIQGTNGVRWLSPFFLRQLREICMKHKALLVADETLTGLRTGRAFCFQHVDKFVPDMIMFGKAIHISGLAVRDNSYFEECTGINIKEFKLHLTRDVTVPADLVRLTMATRVLQVVQERNLLQRSEKVGKALLERLRKLGRQSKKARRSREHEEQEVDKAPVIVRGIGSLIFTSLRLNVSIMSMDPNIVGRLLPPIDLEESYLDAIHLETPAPCVVCFSTGDHELFSCDQCDDQYHERCLGRDIDRALPFFCSKCQVSTEHVTSTALSITLSESSPQPSGDDTVLSAPTPSPYLAPTNRRRKRPVDSADDDADDDDDYLAENRRRSIVQRKRQAERAETERKRKHDEEQKRLQEQARLDKPIDDPELREQERRTILVWMDPRHRR